MFVCLFKGGVVVLQANLTIWDHINEIPEGAGWNALKALRAVNKEVIQAMQFLAMTLLYFTKIGN